MTGLPAAVESRLHELPRGLREHVERSREVARELASIHGVDAVQADLGVAAHDLARAMKGDALLEQSRRYGLYFNPVEQNTPELLHGPLAAYWIEHEDAITDKEILEAVRWHTTGKGGMGDLAKVVFLADKLDPSKIERYPFLTRVKKLAYENMDQAIYEYLNASLTRLLEENQLIHPESLELRNELMIKLHNESSQLAL